MEPVPGDSPPSDAPSWLTALLTRVRRVVPGGRAPLASAAARSGMPEDELVNLAMLGLIGHEYAGDTLLVDIPSGPVILNRPVVRRRKRR